MTFTEYVDECQRRGFYAGLDADPKDKSFAIGPIGMMTEAGEAADMVKKLFWHNHPYSAEAADKLIDEIGDVLWYLGSTLRYMEAMFQDLNDMSPDDIIDLMMDHNLDKLTRRYPQGFSSEASINRQA